MFGWFTKAGRKKRALGKERDHYVKKLMEAFPKLPEKVARKFVNVLVEE
jgi:hypothetical protein